MYQALVSLIYQGKDVWVVHEILHIGSISSYIKSAFKLENVNINKKSNMIFFFIIIYLKINIHIL